MIRENPLIKKLLSLNLPTDDYVVFGSGPMFAYGLKELRDIDLLVRGKAWKEVRKLAKTKDGKLVLFDGEIEVADRWTSDDWDVNKLIDEADIIEGIRFVKLSEVLKWKKQMNRPKDAEHIRLIEEYLRNNNV